MTGGVLETWVEELREEGREQVRDEVRDKDARYLVNTLQELGIPDPEIVRRLEEGFEWEPEKARQKLVQFSAIREEKEGRGKST